MRRTIVAQTSVKQKIIRQIQMASFQALAGHKTTFFSLIKTFSWFLTNNPREEEKLNTRFQKNFCLASF